MPCFGVGNSLKEESERTSADSMSMGLDGTMVIWYFVSEMVKNNYESKK